LLEGVPGIAKTLIVKSLAKISGCESKRIQFTVDLLPSDIVGITTYTPKKGFETIKGPIFTNFVVADEINRSPPKTQSALIEAMQEKQVTIGKQTYKLPPPFFVMANNNPLEQSGVYALPEAQVDRFLFKLLIGYPNNEEEKIYSFGLEQNYPNPFNPSTRIKFTIPSNVVLSPAVGGINSTKDLTQVTLIIYDVLGNEIATLIEEEKPAGLYEIVFEAAGLPSGVYYYQLRAANFVDTRKMIFLK
jgi:hypothetical protein